MIVRKYSPRQDSGPLVDLVRDFFNRQRQLSGKKQNYTRKKAVQTLRKDFKPSAKNLILVAKENNLIIGFIRAQESEGAWFLKEIMVDRKQRNQGTGRKLFDEMLSSLRKKKAPALYLQIVPTNREALTFFTELGIDRINTIELEKRLDGTRLPTYGKIRLSGFSLKV